MDILTELDHVLDHTPPECFATPPLPRRIVAAAAAEIRRQRVLLAASKHALAMVATDQSRMENQAAT